MEIQRLDKRSRVCLHASLASYHVSDEIFLPAADIRGPHCGTILGPAMLDSICAIRRTTMKFHSALKVLALLSATALSTSSMGQPAPATANVPPPAEPAEPGSAAPQKQPPAAVAAPARSVTMQAGDTRGAATASSPPLARQPSITGRSRDEVRAEAVAAVRHHRATLSLDLDLLDGK